eukprot:scaffold135186_cov68-Attheya_sp.AAC.5
MKIPTRRHCHSKKTGTNKRQHPSKAYIEDARTIQSIGSHRARPRLLLAATHPSSTRTRQKRKMSQRKRGANGEDTA